MREQEWQGKVQQRGNGRQEIDDRRPQTAPSSALSGPARSKQQNGSSRTAPSNSWNDDRGDGKRANAASGQDSSKRDETSRQSGKKQGEGTKNNRDGDGKSAADATVDADIVQPQVEEPPRTLVEWFKRLGDTPAKTANTIDARNGSGAETGETPVRSEPAPAAKSPTAKTLKPETADKATGSTAKNTTSAAAQSNMRRSGFDAELLRLGEVRKRQVLASGLDAAGLSKARAMGFKVKASASSPGSPAPVIALTVPEGMSEGAAQAWLEQALPQARFGPNHVYHIYPAAEAARTVTAATSRAPCHGAGCLAKSLLDWKPSLSSCARGVKIGVIDTSFDMSHPALKGRSYDMKDFRASPMAATSDWHGTAVLSVLAGDGGSAAPGLVPDAHFLLAATFGAGTDGQASADAVSVLAALSWLDGKADIINMSFSGPRNDEIELAIRAMAAKGVVFVAAAGNRGPNGPASYPAAYSEVIAVTAVAHDRRGYRHATHGDYVDMAAPGVDVTAALPIGKTGLRTGTSFAAPFVTGMIAALPAVRRGAMTKGDLMARISTRDLGSPGRDPVFGEGLPQAPERCDDIGGVASLPWSPEARRMSLGAGRPSVSQRAERAQPTSAMGWGMGFAP